MFARLKGHESGDISMVYYMRTRRIFWLATTAAFQMKKTGGIANWYMKIDISTNGGEVTITPWWVDLAPKWKSENRTFFTEENLIVFCKKKRVWASLNLTPKLSITYKITAAGETELL